MQNIQKMMQDAKYYHEKKNNKPFFILNPMIYNKLGSDLLISNIQEGKWLHVTTLWFAN